MLNKYQVSSWGHSSWGQLSTGRNLSPGLQYTSKSSTCPECSLFCNIWLWASSQTRNSLGCLFSICPYAHHKCRGTSGWGSYLGVIIATLQPTHGARDGTQVQTNSPYVSDFWGPREAPPRKVFSLCHWAPWEDPFRATKPGDNSHLISCVLVYCVGTKIQVPSWGAPQKGEQRIHWA